MIVDVLRFVMMSEKSESVRTTLLPRGNLPKKTLLVGGIEPSTLGLLDPRSNQLSYTSCS
jgi:hypothetical protein